MKKILSLLALIVLGCMGAWAGVENGKVYTIKAHFTSSSYTDLYLTNSGSTLTFETTSQPMNNYWIAVSEGDKFKFVSALDGKYLSGNDGVSATSMSFSVNECSTVSGTFHLNADISGVGTRNVATWASESNQSGFGKFGGSGCYGGDHNNSNWTTDYIIEDVNFAEVTNGSGTHGELTAENLASQVTDNGYALIACRTVANDSKGKWLGFTKVDVGTFVDADHILVLEAIDGGYTLRTLTGNYFGTANGTANDASSTTSKSEAAVLSLVNRDNGASAAPYSDGTYKLVSFKLANEDGTIYLNCNSTSNTPKWHNGTGDFSLYCVYGVAKTAAVTITYNYKIGEESVGSENISANPGSAFPNPSAPYSTLYNYVKPAGVVNEAGSHDVQLTWNGPFQIGVEYNLRSKNSSHYQYVCDGTNAWYNNRVAVSDKNNFWVLNRVQGSADLFTLKNVGHNKYAVLPSSERVALTFAESPTVWTEGTGATSYFRIVPQNGGFNLQHPGSATTNVGSHVDNKLGSWQAAASATNAASINKAYIEVTYTYQCEGQEDIVVTKDKNYGDLVEDVTIPFGSITNTTPVGGATSERHAYTITYTQNLPFVPGNVYRLKVRNSGDGKFVSFRESDSKPVTNSSNGSAFADENLWSIERVAGTVNDFKLYNFGAKQYLNGNGFSAAGKAYTLGEFTNKTGGFNFVVSGTTNNCIGDHSGYDSQIGDNTQLGEWSGGSNKSDVGSCFWVESIADDIQAMTTIAGDDESVKLGAKTFTVNAAAKTAAAANPTKANYLDLFLPHFVDVVDANKLYRLTFSRAYNGNGSITVTGYAESDGNISDFVPGTSDEATRKVDMQPKNESNISQLWQFVAYGENGQYTLVSPNANGYRLGTPNGTSATSTTHITASEEHGVKLTPSAQATDGYWVLKVNDTSNYLNASNSGTNITSYGNAFNDGGNPILIEEVTTLPLTIKTSKWASMCFPVAVTLPSELTAYVAVKVSSEGIGLDALEGNVVPANTPVIVTTSEELAANKVYTLTIGGTAEDPETNLFTGTTISRQGYDHSSEYNYGLSSGQFVRMTGTTVAANKAFIHATEDLAPAATSPLRVYVVDNTVTGIDAVATPVEQGAYYDLNGRMVAYPTTGVYVRNGKKIFVK